MKRFLIIAACLLLLLSCVAGCSNQPATEGEQNQQAAATKLVVGATAKPHAEILKLSNPCWPRTISTLRSRCLLIMLY